MLDRARTAADATALFLKLRRGFVWVFALLGVGGHAVRALADARRWRRAWIRILRHRGQHSAHLSPSPPWRPASARCTAPCSTPTAASRPRPSTRRRSTSSPSSARCLWTVLGVYAFAIGYTVGAWAQLAIVYFAARGGAPEPGAAEPAAMRWREILAKPAVLRGLRRRPGAEHHLHPRLRHPGGTGNGGRPGLLHARRRRAAGAPGEPISNSLLPEIARLRSLLRTREAFRLIDRTSRWRRWLAVSGCAFALAFRKPAIALLFQRGSFTAESTRLVAAVFLGLGPSLIGWSLMELTSRSLFALDRRRLPVIAGAIPLAVNVWCASCSRSSPRSAPLPASRISPIWSSTTSPAAGWWNRSPSSSISIPSATMAPSTRLAPSTSPRS